MVNRDIENHDSWEKWSVHVLKELHRLNEKQDELIKAISQNNVDIEVLKYRASFWGTIAGAASGTLVMISSILIQYFSRTS